MLPPLPRRARQRSALGSHGGRGRAAPRAGGRVFFRFFFFFACLFPCDAVSKVAAESGVAPV